MFAKVRPNNKTLLGVGHTIVTGSWDGLANYRLLKGRAENLRAVLFTTERYEEYIPERARCLTFKIKLQKNIKTNCTTLDVYQLLTSSCNCDDPSSGRYAEYKAL